MANEKFDIERFYKDRFRILLILYFFSEETGDSGRPLLLYGEIKIQAIDFFLRNPDYLAYELLKIAEENQSKALKIKTIVKNIYHQKEPQLRRVEMEKFFYGAYEDIDDIIAFLVSRGLLLYESKVRTNMRVAEKHYYLTPLAVQKIGTAKQDIEVAQWYFNRCQIIKEHLGGVTGSQLKSKQYQVEEYSTTAYKEKIQGIDNMVEEKYETLFNQGL